MKNPKPSSSSKPSSHKLHSSSSNRKSRWESGPDRDLPSTPADAKPHKPSSNPKDLHHNDAPSSSAAPGGGGGGCGGSGHHPPLPPAGGSPFSSGPAPPTYGFQNLERRSIVLFDGSVRSYFALPPDYPLEPALGLGFDRRFSPDRFREPMGKDSWLDGPRGPPPEGPQWGSGPRPHLGGPSMKRKYPEDDEFAWHRQHVSQYGNANPSFPDRSPMRRGYEDELRAKKGRGGEDLAGPAVLDVDPQAVKRAFLKFAKVVSENVGQRNNYLEDGKNGPLQCLVCGRASKEFSDVHGLIMHAYNSQTADLRVDHLGLHKALCVLNGWNYAKAPENSKSYQSLSADLASANRDDLIIWPPTVIVHNTDTGRRKDGRMEGLGNREMDMKLKDLGFGGGKSKSIYGKEGHTGITVVKFANTQAGLKDAERMAEYFEKDNHGRKGWARAQASQSGSDKEKNPAFVKVDPKSGEKQRILYGYLATASDLEKVDFDIRKRAVIKSRREFDPSE